MPNKIYINPETAITFKASGGTVAFTPTSLAASAGRVSAQHDRGTSARAASFEWRVKTKFNTQPVVNEIIELYLATSDGTIVDGNVGTADAALASGDKWNNLHYIGSIVVDKADVAEVFHASGEFRLIAQKFSVVWWNNTADALSSTAGDHEFIATPIPPEIQ